MGSFCHIVDDELLVIVQLYSHNRALLQMSTKLLHEAGCMHATAVQCHSGIASMQHECMPTT